MIPVRIFIIDDSAVIRTIIERVLETSRECIVVGRSSSADEGRTAIARLRPDAITLDISMPGVDGLQYLEELRPVLHPAMVIVSASTTTGSVAEAEALARGADACFDKARIVSDADAFVDTLKAAIRRRSADADGCGPPSYTSPIGNEH